MAWLPVARVLRARLLAQARRVTRQLRLVQARLAEERVQPLLQDKLARRRQGVRRAVHLAQARAEQVARALRLVRVAAVLRPVQAAAARSRALVAAWRPGKRYTAGSSNPRCR